MLAATNAFFASSIVRHSLSIIAWTWLVWDYVSRFPVEYERVWKSVITERRISSVSAVYIVTRYTGLIGQTVNLICTTWLLTRPAIDQTACSLWFSFESIVIQILFSAVQYVIMLRVDALYLKDWRVRVPLFICWLTERVHLLYIAVETFRALRTDATCMVDPPSVSLVAGMVITITSIQIIIWGLTLARLYVVGGPRSPLTRQLVRDGAFACATIVAFYVVVVPCDFYVEIFIHNIYAFMITVLSNMGCQVILNLRSLPVDEESKSPHTGTNTWCLDTLETSDTITEDDEASSKIKDSS
ncbi:hypothetical protein FPV67DRAFT_300780 [Lyophyllum atratum]|nr:hypothetical protein FPV67DRAFT_300780 [Lyophyllum atratum]